MSVILFKKGNTSTVNGIQCEVQICNEFSFLHLLEQGWHYSPEECYAEEEVTEDTVEDAKPEVDEDAVRAAAKEAGISHWHAKSIDRLEKELKELEEDAERSKD